MRSEIIKGSIHAGLCRLLLVFWLFYTGSHAEKSDMICLVAQGSIHVETNGKKQGWETGRTMW